MKAPPFQPNMFSKIFIEKLKMKTQFQFMKMFSRKMKTVFHNQTHLKRLGIGMSIAYNR